MAKLLLHSFVILHLVGIEFGAPRCVIPFVRSMKRIGGFIPDLVLGIELDAEVLIHRAIIRG